MQSGRLEISWFAVPGYFLLCQECRVIFAEPGDYGIEKQHMNKGFLNHVKVVGW